MKTFCLIALMAVTAGTAARAQSNSIAALLSPRLMHIDSDRQDIDWNGRTVTWSGNVHASEPGLNLTCALLTADLPQSGGRLSHIVAETNVVIDTTDKKGQTTQGTGDKAVYIYNVQNGVTNETITLTALAGNPQPQVENAQGTVAADVIIWDRASNGYQFKGNYHMVSRKTFGVAVDTNSPPTTMNKLTAPKTNLPPGAIDNIDRMNIPTRPQPGF
jgi:lipopolysaccharide export system protein LptA